MQSASLVIQPPVFDLVVWVGMLLMGIAVPLLSVWLLSQARSRMMLISLAWLIVTGFLADRVLLSDTRQILPAIALLSIFSFMMVMLSLWLSRSAIWSNSVSIRTVLWIQGFRLPLELLMWRAAMSGIMPLEFSLQGYNLDVITGVSACTLATVWPHLTERVARAWVMVWNLWGIGCLLMITVLAVLCSPQVHFFGQTAVHINTWVLFFPYVWLPTALVPCAVLGHVLISSLTIKVPQSKCMQNPSMEN